MKNAKIQNTDPTLIVCGGVLKDQRTAATLLKNLVPIVNVTFALSTPVLDTVENVVKLNLLAHRCSAATGHVIRDASRRPVELIAERTA